MDREFNPAIRSVAVTRFDGKDLHTSPDKVTMEAPLQIVLRYGPRHKRQLSNLAMTMRTPGQDSLLATGYLYTENIIHKRSDILQIKQLQEDEILVDLREDLPVNLLHQERNSYVNSSCGVCGKHKLDDIRSTIPFMLQRGNPTFLTEEILDWTTKLEKAQTVFASTGGIHAAALIGSEGVVAIQEDIGRHNAVDKLIGFSLQQFPFPLTDKAIVVSSRASFELVQKALMAGIPLMAAVGATSSLAIELAEENGMTLIGFLRPDRFNIYTHSERVSGI